MVKIGVGPEAMVRAHMNSRLLGVAWACDAATGEVWQEPVPIVIHGPRGTGMTQSASKAFLDWIDKRTAPVLSLPWALTGPSAAHACTDPGR